MAYNRKNFLIKVLNIQAVYNEYSNKGMPNIWIYQNLIQPNYFISNTTFYAYLNINARKELSDMGENWKDFINPPVNLNDNN